jgi:hypothetical protein
MGMGGNPILAAGASESPRGMKRAREDRPRAEALDHEAR